MLKQLVIQNSSQRNLLGQDYSKLLDIAVIAVLAPNCNPQNGKTFGYRFSQSNQALIVFVLFLKALKYSGFRGKRVREVLVKEFPYPGDVINGMRAD